MSPTGPYSNANYNNAAIQQYAALWGVPPSQITYVPGQGYQVSGQNNNAASQFQPIYQANQQATGGGVQPSPLNPIDYASPQTAQQLATLLGGQVVPDTAMGTGQGASIGIPTPNGIQLPNGQIVDAGQIANLFQRGYSPEALAGQLQTQSGIAVSPGKLAQFMGAPSISAAPNPNGTGWLTQQGPYNPATAVPPAAAAQAPNNAAAQNLPPRQLPTAIGPGRATPLPETLPPGGTLSTDPTTGRSTMNYGASPGAPGGYSLPAGWNANPPPAGTAGAPTGPSGMMPRGTAPASVAPSGMQPRDTGGAAGGSTGGGSGILGGILGFLGAGRAATAVSDAAWAAEQGTLGAAINAGNDVTGSLGINSNATIGAQNNAINNVQQFGNYAQNLLGGNLSTSLGNTNPFVQGGQFGVGALQNLASSPYQVTTPAWQGANQGQGPPQFTAAPGNGPNGTAGAFGFWPSQTQLEGTPGYQFERQAGLNAIQNQSSAGGAGIGSNQDLEAAKFATGLASANYEQAFQNAAQGFGLNQGAFNQTYQNALQGFGANNAAYNAAFGNALAGTQANYGMAFQPTEALTQAGLGGTGQANQALLGFGLPAASYLYNTGMYGGNAVQNTAALNAQQGLQGNEFIANLGLTAAQQAGAFALEGAGANAAGILGQYNNLASGAAGIAPLLGVLAGL